MAVNMYGRYSREDDTDSIHENSSPFSPCPCSSCRNQRERDKEREEEELERNSRKRKEDDDDFRYSESIYGKYPSNYVKCKYCGNSKLLWGDNEDGWHLYEGSIKHECRKNFRLGKSAEKILAVDKYSDLKQMTPTTYYLDTVSGSSVDLKLCIFKSIFQWYILTTYPTFSGGGVSDEGDRMIFLSSDLKWREWNKNKPGFDNEQEALKAYQKWRNKNEKIRLEYEND